MVLPSHKDGFKFAIMASGRGSNAEVLLEAFRNNKVPGRVGVLISDHEDAPCLEIAKRYDVPSVAIPKNSLTKPEHEAHILECLKAHEIEHILLAGYMRILSAGFIEESPGTILNIHPTLLPDFKGINTAERQCNAGVRVTGATVHEVIPDVDSGPIILQGSIEIDPTQGPDKLSERVLNEVEHVIYPRAIWLFTARKLGLLEE